MLTLSYNGTVIPTGEDFSLRIKWVNPCCFHNEIQGDVALGIEIPVNDYTRAYFGNPHRFEKYASASDRKFLNVDIRYAGVLLMNGTLNITNATSESYSAWLQSAVGYIGEEQREKYINELDWSEFEGKTLDNKGTFDDETDDYCTGEIYNRRFWESIGKTVPDTEIYYDSDGVAQERPIEISQLQVQHRDNFAYLVNKSQSNIVITTGDGCVVSAYLFLKFLLTNLFKLSDLFIDDDHNAFDTVTGYNNLALYNNFNLMQPTFATTTRDEYVEDINTGEINLITYTEITGITVVLSAFNYSRLIPHVKMGDFLLGIQNLLNFVFVFRYDNRVAIIDRDAVITGTYIDIDDYIAEEWIMGEQKDVTLKFVSEHDPNDSTIADNWHDLTERRDDIGDDVWDMTALEAIASPVYGEIRHVLSRDEYYEYKWDVSVTIDAYDNMREFDKVGWVLASTGPQPVWHGTGDEIEEIKTCISSPQHFPGVFAITTVLQEGAVEQIRTLWNNFTPRLFFHGGNNFVANFNGSGYSIYWDGPTGLFEKRWSNWANFWITRMPVEGRFDFPLNVIVYVLANITSKFRTRHGEFIIEEMECEFSTYMIGRTTIRGYKV